MKFKFDAIRSDTQLFVEYAGGTIVRVNYEDHDVSKLVYSPTKPPPQMPNWLNKVELVAGEYIVTLVYPYGYGESYDSFEVVTNTPQALFDNRS